MEFRELRFYLKDEFGNKWETKQKVEIDEDASDIEELTNSFKAFLKYCGYADVTVSHIQCLENEEWKQVLQKYEEWDDRKEEVYRAKEQLGVGL